MSEMAVSYTSVIRSCDLIIGLSFGINAWVVRLTSNGPGFYYIARSTFMGSRQLNLFFRTFFALVGDYPGQAKRYHDTITNKKVMIVPYAIAVWKSRC